GTVPHDALEAVYNSADLFLLGSRQEGSGYAALEALACGVVPLLTDIPSFRAIVGDGEIGALWLAGGAGALAHPLIEADDRPRPQTPGRVRAYFEARWGFEAIGRQAYAIYRQLCDGPTP